VSEIAKVIDRVARDALAAPLKAAAYQKAGRTWRRRVGDAIQVVNVQASRMAPGTYTCIGFVTG
jgi:type IV secretory pathway TrbF-like protein